MCITCAFCVVPATILPLFAWLRIKKNFRILSIGSSKKLYRFFKIKNAQNLLIENLIIIQPSLKTKTFLQKGNIIFSLLQATVWSHFILNKAATGVWVCTWPV
jgi:hypothetical protein